MRIQVLGFSWCIRNLVPIKVPQGVSELCEISKDNVTDGSENNDLSNSTNTVLFMGS